MAEHTFPNQRVSISTKLKEDWYLNNIHYWIGNALSSNDKTEVSNNYDAANGIVNTDTYNYVLKPLAPEDGNVLDINEKLPGEIRDVDFITPIKEKNLGEYLSLPYDINTIVVDPDVAISKNTHVAQAITPYIEKIVVELMNQAAPNGGEEGQQEINPDEIREKIDEATNEWVNNKAIAAEHFIHTANHNNRFQELRATAYYDWWATEQVYFHNYMINGKYFFEVLNPLESYPIANNYEYVDDNDGFLIRRMISIFEVKDKYADKLTAKDLKYLTKIYEQDGHGTIAVTAGIIMDIYGSKRFTDETGYTRMSRNTPLSFNATIPENIVYFKTDVKHTYVLRFTPMGTTTEVLVDDKYELNPEAGDIELKDIWINQTWQQILLGEEYTGIYLKPEPTDLQLYDASGHVKIPITGKKDLLPNIDNNPIPKRIIANLALYRIITLQIERTMAKYKGSVELIPKSMIVGKTPQETKGKMFYRIADNTIIYDDAVVPPTSAIQGYRIVGNDSLSTYLRTLMDLRIGVKDEAWDMANMNDSRYGNAPASATVTNNQQNIFRAKLGSVLMVYIFNKILERQHTMSAEFMKASNPTGLIGSYFKPNGDTVSFNIDPANLTYEQLGVFVTNGIEEEEVLRQFKDLAVAGQIGDPELAAKAIVSSNSKEIQKYIKDYGEAKREFEESQSARLAEIEREKIAFEKAKMEHEKDMLITEQDMITEREIKLKGMDTEAKAVNNK